MSSDHFGIGAAMRAMHRVYAMSARRTGRTTSLVESVKDGDRIVFASTPEARRVERLLRERGVKVECIVVEPKQPGKLVERGTSQGRTIFDHAWVAHFYELAIEDADRAIGELQEKTSGYGPAHRETKRRAEELARWGR